MKKVSHKNYTKAAYIEAMLFYLVSSSSECIQNIWLFRQIGCLGCKEQEAEDSQREVAHTTKKHIAQRKLKQKCKLACQHYCYELVWLTQYISTLLIASDVKYLFFALKYCYFALHFEARSHTPSNMYNNYLQISMQQNIIKNCVNSD